eukprot:CAMPEP_0179088852 /NCGR_PEP_ID=MMETSP0796-20121207/40452_1 /TAXON_ID=73915 /ORGANISM="Pyrodinium bahamense, Strain pbaha01" /LENGTH=78 /DNA_ID=CAMNT_0020786393 /DNA_START=182 /DNA_END=415 /DNA_ORIENTATION=+
MCSGQQPAASTAIGQLGSGGTCSRWTLVRLAGRGGPVSALRRMNMRNLVPSVGFFALRSANEPAHAVRAEGSVAVHVC